MLVNALGMDQKSMLKIEFEAVGKWMSLQTTDGAALDQTQMNLRAGGLVQILARVVVRTWTKAHGRRIRIAHGILALRHRRVGTRRGVWVWSWMLLVVMIEVEVEPIQGAEPTSLMYVFRL
jgi:hypothetical protein